MNFTEKAAILTRSLKNATWVGGFQGSVRLGMPEEIRYQDGPQGFRAVKPAQGTSTAWPSLETISTSWDR
jgi:hypothetical protein